MTHALPASPAAASSVAALSVAVSVAAVSSVDEHAVSTNEAAAKPAKATYSFFFIYFLSLQESPAYQFPGKLDSQNSINN
jgi:hypothetical protein